MRLNESERERGAGTKFKFAEEHQANFSHQYARVEDRFTVPCTSKLTASENVSLTVTTHEYAAALSLALFVPACGYVGTCVCVFITIEREFPRVRIESDRSRRRAPGKGEMERVIASFNGWSK